MRVKDAVLADKKILDWGKWARGGKVPKSEFYLIKSNQFRFGSGYRWRVIKFEALGESFRVLTAYNLEKEQYFAHLAVVAGPDMKLLTSYEFHGTHPGWHIHAACGDIAHVPVGRQKGSWNRRIPTARQLHRKTIYNINDSNAVTVACDVFRIVESMEDTGQLQLK